MEAAGGALLASALDLVALAAVRHGPRAVLHAPEDAEEMRRPVPGAAPGVLADAWGLGLALFQQGTQQWCGHDGNAQGTSCHLRAEPDSGAVVAFTSNANNGTTCGTNWPRTRGDHRLRGPRPPDRGRTSHFPSAPGSYHNGTVEYQGS